MMKVEDLKPFCSTDEFRASICVPFCDKEYTVATDGHIIVRFTDLPCDNPDTNAPATAFLFTPAAMSQALGDIPDVPPQIKCEKCDDAGRMKCVKCRGAGDHRCWDCESEHECGNCEGRGSIQCEECQGTKITEPEPMIVGTRKFKVSLLRLAKTLPNVQIGIDGDAHKPAHLVFDGGDGLLMPMRQY